MDVWGIRIPDKNLFMKKFVKEEILTYVKIIENKNRIDVLSKNEKIVRYSTCYPQELLSHFNIVTLQSVTYKILHFYL